MGDSEDAPILEPSEEMQGGEAGGDGDGSDDDGGDGECGDGDGGREDGDGEGARRRAPCRALAEGARVVRIGDEVGTRGVFGACGRRVEEDGDAQPARARVRTAEGETPASGEGIAFCI